MLEQGGAWDSYFSLVEFTYNNNFHSSIGMTPYESLYGRRCITPSCRYELSERVMLGSEIVHQTTEKIKMIQKKRKASQSR